MNKYNDFPTLTNEQYKQLNSGYQTSSKDTISELANKLEFCINSFAFICPDLNLSLQKQSKNAYTQLTSVKESLKLLYPRATFLNNSHSKNLFTILQEVANLVVLLNKISTCNSKAYYNKVLHKLELEVVDTLQVFMKELSKLEIKVFKFM